MAKDEKCPWFPFYGDDWIASMAEMGWSFDQAGRYVNALALSWRSDTPGVNDEDAWRRWFQLTPKQWEKQRDVIALAFTITESGGWVQERLREEWEKVLVRRNRAANGAAKTNGKRWGNSLSERHDSGSHSDTFSDS